MEGTHEDGRYIQNGMQQWIDFPFNDMAVITRSEINEEMIMLLVKVTSVEEHYITGNLRHLFTGKTAVQIVIINRTLISY